MSERTDGRFQKGSEGGPGRPKGPGLRRMPDDVREHLQCATMASAKVMTDCLEATKAVLVGRGEGQQDMEMVPDFDMRLKAATVIMDRLYGKPTQAISGPDGEPFRLDVNAIAGSLKKLAGE